MDSFKDLPQLDPLNWAAMIRLGETRTYAPGEVIFAEGTPAQRCYVVISGLVELLKATVSEACVRLAILDESTFFGEGALFQASSRSTTAKAFRETVLVEIPSEVLIRFLGETPVFSALLYRALSERLHQVVLDLDLDLRTMHHRLNHPQGVSPARQQFQPAPPPPFHKVSGPDLPSGERQPSRNSQPFS